jgi:hypothetical protein
MNVYDRINQRYGFMPPDEYRSMDQAGFFDFRNKRTYLWIPEAEWLPPKKILTFEFEEFHKPGFVPFAHTAAGDHWCWWPGQHDMAVVQCPHDSIEAWFDAPSFVGSIYRRVLDYCLDILPDDQVEVCTRLAEWVIRLDVYFPPTWIETLKRLSTAKPKTWRRKEMSGYGLLSITEYESLVKRDLGFPRLNKTFEWMNL